MKRVLFFFLILYGFAVSAQRNKEDFFTSAQTFFPTYVINGQVNYQAVKNDSVFVSKILEQIKSFSIRQAGFSEREAFYLNAYNILVITSVADHYPVKSALDISGFFDIQLHNVGGDMVTLNEFEKVIIENEYPDTRIRLWLVPAAVGSPAVNNKAMMLYNVNDLLDEQAKTALNNNEYIGIDKEHKEVLVPVLFKINEADYSVNGKTVLDYINSYRKKKINYGFKINYYFFNTDLNDYKGKSKPGIKIPLNEPFKETDSVSKTIPEKPIEKIHKDSIISSDTINSYEDILSQGSFMLKSVFQLRALGSLNTQHAIYNVDLNRVDNSFRSTNFNFAVQGWNRISNRVNYGVQLTFRSLVMSGYDSSPYDALTFSNSKSSKFYFKDVINSVKYLFSEKKWRITGITSLVVPGSKNNVVSYRKDSLIDLGQTQWINQLFFNRTFSKYFTLNSELNGTYRFNVSNKSNALIVRGSLLPEFNYWFTPAIRFYAFCELNPQLNNGFFSSFYFREGLGFTFLSQKISQWDVQYHYYALGKRSSATSSLVFGGRFNF